jgi:hypothetical protein
MFGGGGAGQKCLDARRAPVSASAAGATWHADSGLLGTQPSTSTTDQHGQGMWSRERHVTYCSVSESSVSRLLATLLCRPSESSLWFRGSALGRLTCGTGGMSSLGSRCERSSWLAADLVRLLRPLNILDMRRRWCDEVSLRASSEPRLHILSSAPSADLRRSSSRVSLLATETAEDSGPLDVARLAGAARLSRLAASRKGLGLRARSTVAIVGRFC